MNDPTQAWAIANYGNVETLSLVELPLASPGDGELVVAVEAMSLNPLDLKIMAGRMKQFLPAVMPYVPGSDFVGIVLKAGAGGPAATGDRVVISAWHGGLAQKTLVPAGAQVAAAPGAADASALAALPMAALTANFILRDIGSVEGCTLAIRGATGGVGLALAQLAQQRGAVVIGSSGSRDDEALLRANGVHSTIDYSGGSFIATLCTAYPRGVDVMVDLVSMFEALGESAQAVRDGGLLLSTLFGPDPCAFGDRIVMRYIRLKPEPGDLAAMVASYVDGRLKANVTRRFGFDRGRAAYLALRDDHARGKIVVTM